MNTYYNLTEDAAYDKKHPVIEAIKLWVDEQYDEGRVTAIGDKELYKVSKRIIDNFNKGKND